MTGESGMTVDGDGDGEGRDADGYPERNQQMLSSLKQNALFLILVVSTCNTLLLSGTSIYASMSKPHGTDGYEIIECGDSAGRIHKCTRVDAKAGEINDASKGATYRVIFGQ